MKLLKAILYDLVPSSGPRPELENVGKDYATIKWKEIPKSERNGVIINYTIIYKTDNQQLGMYAN